MAATGHDFELDDFQRRAIAAIDEGRSVLVAAPTGSGKTVVAEHAIADALRTGGKAFYTAPIKALSNQKYADLVRLHGPELVGLLTGDNSVNGDAPIVVMTTEVLRNMIYAASPALRGLRYVVLDEVHYLQDAYRGPVWEEVIIHLHPSVRLVCLSATVSNAEELTDWIETVRGPTAAIVEHRRPVELRNLFMVADRSSDRIQLLPMLVDGRPNPEGLKLDAAAQRGPRKRTGPQRPQGRRLAAPRRIEVLDRLDEERMLPAIYFIFSRKACDEAVGQCLEAGLRLTDPEERARIRTICAERTAALAPADLEVLGHRRWLAGMQAGIASHHAGMVPPFKEAVEACFTAGLVKVVFATETLALGINMPARSVVIERFSKFNGERNETLTPGQYTQLTGRAGRRGIDPVGDAVVLWSPFTTFEEIAGRAASRSFAISSSFRPTYNMAANLVRRYQPAEARHLLNLSFAQYQSDGEVVRIETRLDRASQKLDAARAELRCDRGDVAELFDLERRLEADRADRPDRRRELEDALGQLKPGDVIQAPCGRNGGAAVVTATINRRNGLGIRALTAQRRRLQLTAEDFDRPPERLGRIDLPEPYAPNTTRFQREAAQSLGRARLSHGTRMPKKGDARGDGGDLDEVWLAIAAHPAATCPDLGLHRRAAAQVARYERDRGALERQVRGRDATLARHFDRVLDLLEQRRYLDGWHLTDAGARLARIYHEADLLIADCLERGLLDGLDGPALAGLASGFVYEHRGASEPPTPWFPSAEARRRWRGIEQLHQDLNADEERRRLPLTRAPDPGFVALAYAWAAGEGLDDLLADDEVSGGDFVRTVKQLLDLLRQLAEVAEVPATREAARSAAEGLFRGVIAASSAGPVVEDGPQVDEPDEHDGDLPVRSGGDEAADGRAVGLGGAGR